MTGKLDEMSDPTEALYVADPSMSIGTHTPLNWRRGKVPRGIVAAAKAHGEQERISHRRADRLDHL